MESPHEFVQRRMREIQEEKPELTHQLTKMKCYGCGVEKDLDKLESSPYFREDRRTSKPIEPLSVLECEGINTFDNCRAVVVCHECFHKLNPDMWISINCWEKLNPKVSFENLPEAIQDEWNAKSYPDLVKEM